MGFWVVGFGVGFGLSALWATFSVGFSSVAGVVLGSGLTGDFAMLPALTCGVACGAATKLIATE
ncbi:hypothetical protein K6U15_14560, partial [Vibrio parahaemolyticus]|nr:hypothetical protein [Vibrio parahaemolyticus]